ncbi:MAG: asparagine N-glycosylation enzyme membrane subunit Stt3 [Myxococcota bacterium]|jgi:asparagine N-glycosylation enzyme membrane subunit Stt3
MKAQLSLWLTLAALMMVIFCSWQMRATAHATQQYTPGSDQWYSLDSDGMYHMRRLSEYRQADGMPSARDEALNYPHGAIIPWPPYYTLVADRLVTADATDAEIEMEMGSLPLYFSVITSLLVALGALMIAGRGAAVIAGLLHALSYGSAHYGGLGVADHHALVALLNVLILCCFSLMSRFGGFSSIRFCIGAAGIGGAAVGLMLGIWVGALMYLVPLQLVCLWWLYDYFNRQVVLFVSLFHLSALVVLLPAILQSPWLVDYPWMVINLSYFHLLWLALGILLPLPLYFSSSIAFTHRYVQRTLMIGGAIAAVIFAFDFPPASGILEGFAWVSRVDAFMSGIAESAPLVGASSGGFAEFAVWIGWSVVMLPFAYFWAWRKRGFLTPILLPWLVVLLPLFIQACAQRRFADALSGPLAVVAAVSVWHWLERTKFNTLIKTSIAGAFIVATQFAGIVQAVNHSESSTNDPVAVAEHKLFSWIAEQQPDSRSVLAAWDFGHTIEWTAKRPSIATNFGSYIGRDSFVDPAIFFMTEDFAVAEEILSKRKVQYIVVTSRLPDLLASHVLRIDADVKEYRQIVASKAQQLTKKWFTTMAAQVFNFGDADGAAGPAPSIPFLRLVHVSPTLVVVAEQLGTRTAAGRIWEYVKGARVTGVSQPNSSVSIEIDFAFFDNGKRLVSNSWTSSAVCDAQGHFEIRVPYCSGSNRDAQVSEMRWSDANGVHVFELNESQVLNGETVRLK